MNTARKAIEVLRPGALVLVPRVSRNPGGAWCISGGMHRDSAVLGVVLQPVRPGQHLIAHSDAGAAIVFSFENIIAAL